MQRAAFVYALLWFDTFCWHGVKWRLNNAVSALWGLGTPLRDAGVVELVQLVVAHCRPPEEVPGAVVETYPEYYQDERLNWRCKADGRLLGSR